jgi:hypothetical protein
MEPKPYLRCDGCRRIWVREAIKYGSFDGWKTRRCAFCNPTLPLSNYLRRRGNR